MNPTVTVTRRGEERILRGHPWVYRSDIAAVADASAGDVVAVVSGTGRRRRLGSALYSDRSEIAIRMVTREDEPIDDAFWQRRLEQAIEYRRSLAIESTDTTAYRLVHGEGDLLPSLIVDRYDDCLVLQALSQGTDRLQPVFAKHLAAITNARGILARNDPRVRLLEGLEQEVSLLHGEVPDRLLVREAGLEYEIDPWRGQKTGLFLDQRENRLAARAWARGRLLDCFSYQGGFALVLAPVCESVLALDISEEAVAGIQANAARNHVTNVEARAVNVFDDLRELDRAAARFDTIVLDPPAFAKNRASVGKATAGYKEINLRAMKLLAPGGVLVTCSCSYNVDEELFGAIIQQAAADARVHMVLVEKRIQGRDHPVLIGVPETYYLKCFILRKLQ